MSVSALNSIHLVSEKSPQSDLTETTVTTAAYRFLSLFNLMGRPGPVGGGGEPTVNTGDWRSQLHPVSRQRIVNKIMDTLKRHLPFYGQEGLQELKKMAVKFEEKIYSSATSKSDYLRQISLKMLTMETKSKNTATNSPPSNSGNNSENSTHAVVNLMGRPGPVIGGGEPTVNTGDWRSELHLDSRQRIVNKIIDTLMRHLPFSGQEGLEELKKIALRFEENIYTSATSQPDYLRKISLKMLTEEAKSENNITNSLASNSGNNSGNFTHTGDTMEEEFSFVPS
ncbi:uncharacterized protein LOC131315336 isoform X1 [Rhododendron vialii]|uniref:uncharacterized protein LOC131315336 isoform X1 n=2 Tax=Rhododendron vialii TaxID=182163 RepID=UPI00265E45E9|nr:uncharacterized protein LOC131315336 isoform X1 [Rhododendron vialii]